jgi:hypothetical protein
MRTRPLLPTLLAIAATSLVFGCADDEQKEEAADEVGDGDGDKGGQEEIGDGDGEPAGDGDGEPAGDGDGEPAGDGDGEPAGDGDGEPAGDGDGEPAEACQTEADMIAADVMHTEGGCTIVVRFNYESLEPLGWASTCAPASDNELKEEDARKLSECCSDGKLLSPAEDQRLFVFYKAPETEGGVSVISNHLADRSFEGTIVKGGMGDITLPKEWKPAEDLGEKCGAKRPMGEGYDLTMGGTMLDKEEHEKVLGAFADTALTKAIELHGKINRTVTLAYPRAVDPLDPKTAEYVIIVESGKEAP